MNNEEKFLTALDISKKITILIQDVEKSNSGKVSNLLAAKQCLIDFMKEN